MLEGQQDEVKTPSYLKEFHCALAYKTDNVHTSPHSLTKVLRYDNVSYSFKFFFLAISMEHNFIIKLIGTLIGMMQCRKEL